MKNPKVGDRVRIKYDSMYQGLKGHISHCSTEYQSVKLDDGTGLTFHRKQLRRLKPPKPKVKPPEFFEVKIYKNGHIVYETTKTACFDKFIDSARNSKKDVLLIYKLVEVIPVDDK